MSERKVLNKYFPPDFDPSKIPRRKIARDAQQVVRLMAPCTMCCLTCGEFIYKGKKFNAKKETVQGEEYYGIKIFRFYIKCTRCSAEITFKTDPKNADYIIDNGATRNYEPWQEAIPNASADDEEPKADEEDPMAMLEASQAASKRQMEEEDALADLRTRNARIARADVDSEAILAQQHANSALEAERARMEKEEEDEIVNQYFYKVAKPGTAASSSANVPMSNHKGKGKETKPAGNGVGLGGYGSDVVSDSEEDEDDEEEEPVTVTVKRGIVPNTKADAQPTVQDLLAARGIVLGGSSPSSAPAAVVKKPGFNLAAGGVKRKDLASSLGIKFAKKKKV